MVWLHANLMRLWSDGVGGMVWAPQPMPVSGELEQSSSSFSEGLFALVGRIVGFGDWLRNHASRVAVVAVIGLLGTAVVCLALLAGTGFFHSSELPTPMRPPRVAGDIAEIAAVESPVWSADARSWRLWDGLLPATKVALESGRVEIACDDGATIVLEGPAVLELKTRTDVVLDRGKATITISKAGKRPARFTLQTPSATVTDIGTSFGVMVDKAGETRSVGRGDRLTGRQTRAILLDTTGPTWRVVFFVDGHAVGESSVASAAAITHVCLSTFPNTQVVFRSFLVSSFSHLDR